MEKITMSDAKIFCEDCNTQLKEEVCICPQCGSNKRILLNVEDEIKTHEQIKIKSKSKQGGRTRELKYIKGHEKSVSHGMVHKEMIVDEINKKFFEEIKDMD